MEFIFKNKSFINLLHIFSNTGFILKIILFVLICVIILNSINQNIDAESKNESCITYNSFDNVITITCEFSNLTDVYNVIRDDNIIKKESENNWILNAQLVIRDSSTFYINSMDTTWLKLNSDGVNTSKLKVYGNLLIDSVKITSWNNTINDYATTDGDTPRSHIIAAFRGTGNVNITNSEIAYLGYHKGGENGLAYMKGGHNSIIKNNNIHDLWYGFYSNGVGGIVIENNHFHHNNIYAIDPHTVTYDMIIRNNTVHHTNGLGIVCSLDCYNILIENNEIYKNRISVFFSRNMTDSIVRNNLIYDSDSGIEFSASSNNHVYNNNTIVNTIVGITVKTADKANEEDIGKGYSTTNNFIENNLISNSTDVGILVRNGATNNTISQNFIQNSNGIGIYVHDLNAINNLFLENIISNVANPIKIENNTSSKFENNIVVENKQNLTQNIENLFINDYLFFIITVTVIGLGIFFIYFRKMKK